MRPDARPDLHLTYCTNIHPGERWADVREALQTHVPAVKERVAPDRPFGVGLRLGASAVDELAAPAARAELLELLQRGDLYVFTLNGFPYGPFHGTPVKEAVYRPDWSEPARLTYTRRLVELLAVLLPEGVEGSISTVPGCFRPRAGDPRRVDAIAHALLSCAAELWQRAQTTGTTIVLALEPEPHCLLERVDETVAFFELALLRGPAFDGFAKATGLDHARAEAAVRRHLGVCLDTCHAAVQFEDPVGCVEQLRAAAIRIAKVQVTTGLRVAPVTAAQVERLSRFADPVYLHQTVAHHPGGLRRFLDLPEAIEGYRRGDVPEGEWRVHYHVPVFSDRLDAFENTQAFLRPCLDEIVRTDASRHFEVETYTWDVLPAEQRDVPVEDAIAREIQWTLERLST